MTSEIRKIKKGLYKLPGGGGIQWMWPFTRRFRCLFGWDAAVEKACEQYDTKELATLLPGANAVDSVMLPAIAQLGNEPKLQMLEDCPHIMWWDKKKELLADYEAASIGQDAELKNAIDDVHFPLRARTFFEPCTEGPCANGEMVETLRECRAKGPPMYDSEEAPLQNI